MVSFIIRCLNNSKCLYINKKISVASNRTLRLFWEKAVKWAGFLSDLLTALWFIAGILWCIIDPVKGITIMIVIGLWKLCGSVLKITNHREAWYFLTIQPFILNFIMLWMVINLNKKNPPIEDNFENLIHEERFEENRANVIKYVLFN